MKQKFETKNRYGLKIAGELWMPENPSGLAVLIHGLSGSKDEPHMQIIAKTFYGNNYTVVNFDTTNSFGESEGLYENATTKLHYEDLVDVLIWCKKQSFYNEPFVLIGSSLGGYAVSRYAEEFPNEVKALFPFATVVSGELSKKFNPEKIKKWQESGWLHEESIKRGTVKSLPWSHMEERFNHDILPDADKLTMPMLFVVGSKDKPHIEDNQVLFDAVENSREREFHVVKGAPHTFREPEHLEELARILDKWLKKI
jgi:pimeloyl-ACP methyl ester carboxylesterase